MSCEAAWGSAGAPGGEAEGAKQARTEPAMWSFQIEKGRMSS